MQPTLHVYGQIATMRFHAASAAGRKFSMPSYARILRAAGAALVFMLASDTTAAAADAVKISDPWVRATVPGQSVAGAYMGLTSNVPAALIAADSPVARKTEPHATTFDGGVMKMRAVERIELPANETVVLKPGGYHLMLVDIKRELKPGDRVPLTLILQDRNGARSTMQLDAEVRAAAVGTMPHPK
jgi:copper(I)-binding protein